MIHPVDAAALGAIARTCRLILEELTHDEQRRSDFFNGRLTITEGISSTDTKGGLSSILQDVGGNDPYPGPDAHRFLEVRMRSMNDLTERYFSDINFVDDAAGELDRNARRREIFRRVRDADE